MKKIITKHFYKISLLFLILFYILSIYFNSKTLNFIFLALISFIVFLLYSIRKCELDEIGRKFFTEQHYIEEKEERYMSERELSALYDKIYSNHFNC